MHVGILSLDLFTSFSLPRRENGTNRIIIIECEMWEDGKWRDINNNSTTQQYFDLFHLFTVWFNSKCHSEHDSYNNPMRYDEQRIKYTCDAICDGNNWQTK